MFVIIPILSYEAFISEVKSPKHSVIAVSVSEEEQGLSIRGPNCQQRPLPALMSAAASCPLSPDGQLRNTDRPIPEHGHIKDL